MENFNLKRFGRTLYWYISENRSTLIRWTIGSAIGVLLMEMLFVWIMTPQVQKEEAFYTQAVLMGTGVCIVAITFAVLVAWSCIFNPLKTKQQRTAFFMLPATNLERYLTAFLYGVVLWPICIILAYIIGDALRSLFFMLLGHDWLSGISTMMHSTGHEGSLWVGIEDDIFDYLTFIWICSAYVLGGTLLRKYSFAIVSGFFILLGGISATIIVKCMPAIALNHDIFFSLASIALLAFTAFNFWYSYRTFTRFQIITHKMTNV